MELGRFVMLADPAPEPSAVQCAPRSVVLNRPTLATPAMTVDESGVADSSVRLPHSDCMLARLPVALTHAEGGACPASPPEPAVPPELTLPLEPPEPDRPLVPPEPARPLVPPELAPPVVAAC